MIIKIAWTVFVKRLYDVSAVDIPAYDDTSSKRVRLMRRRLLGNISARRMPNLCAKKLILKLKLEV